MRSERRWLVAAVSVLSAAAALSGCGSRTAAPPAGGADSSFAAIAFQRGTSPLALSEARGRVVYGHDCAICHGETGGGDGFNAYNVTAAFGVSPTAFDDPATFHAIKEDRAMAVIRDGGYAAGRSPAMPPWGKTLTAGEIVDVWQYIRSLSAGEPKK